MAKQQQITKFQERVYAALQQIPEGRITTYAAMARALESSPRSVGGACRSNPWAPMVPCHRCIASTGFVGGYKGDWEDAPSGQNQVSKLALLKEEGISFDENGFLIDKTVLWYEFDMEKLRK